MAAVAELIQLVSDSHILARMTASALSVALYDMLLTLDVERVHIWRAPWSLTKGIYFSCRYLGILNLFIYFLGNSSFQISKFKSLCEAYIWFATVWVVLSSMTPCNLLLAQRLYYLFQRAPRIRLLLISLFTCELMAHITIVTLLATHTQLQDTRLISGALGCSNTVINGGSLIIISAIPDLFLTCIYFGFAFVKYLEHIRERSSMSSLRAIRDSGDLAPLLSLLFRDGVLFYALIFATVLTNGFTLGIFHNRLLSGVAFPWITAIYSIAGSRLLLMLRGNTNEALGIYNEGTELRVNAPIQLDELDELPVLTISWSDGASEHKK